MIKRLLSLKKESLLRDNFYLFIGNSTLYFLSYLYQFYLGHTFLPKDYSLVGTIFAILTIISLILYSIQLSITNFISGLKLKDINISYLYELILKKAFKMGLIFSLIMLLISPFLAIFLHINSYILFIFIALSIIILTILMATRGILQGIENFKRLGLNYIIEGLFRLIIGILFILIGFKINGVMGALFCSYLIAALSIYFYLNKNKSSKKIEINFNNFYQYLPHTFITLTLLNIMGVLDLLLARHFLNFTNSGYYVAINLLGKIIPSLCITVGLVLFPKIKHKNKSIHKRLLFKSLLISSIIITPIILTYFLMPETIIQLIFGNNYLFISEYIGLFSVSMGLYALSSIIVFFNLGLNKKKTSFTIASFLFLEILLISFFHKNILEIIKILLITKCLFFISLILPIYLDWKKKYKINKLFKY